MYIYTSIGRRLDSNEGIKPVNEWKFSIAKLQAMCTISQESVERVYNRYWFYLFITSTPKGTEINTYQKQERKTVVTI